MDAFQGFNVYYGDLHNHCGISYGHGTLEDALKNARLQLDFCSVTGHALWPDMPPPGIGVDHIRDFHLKGFAKLDSGWKDVLKKINAANCPGKFVTFPGFEMHSSNAGDYTVIYGDDGGEILKVASLDELKKRISQLRNRGVSIIAFPHHIGYIPGGRGINWSLYDSDISPLVELISMHGCSENDESPRTYLHTMGPMHCSNTVKSGLRQKKKFGFIGCTDHHSAFPGSFGHGKTGLWASGLSRSNIWEALNSKRTFALTGDKIELKFAVNNYPMGESISNPGYGKITVDVKAGAAIDYLDIVKNGELYKRYSQPDIPDTGKEASEKIHTKIFLEVGWGERGRKASWDVSLGISDGKVINVEPRFRGLEILSPLDKSNNDSSCTPSSLDKINDTNFFMQTETWGNPNNFTNSNQGLCLEVECSEKAVITAEINGKKISIPIRLLQEGSISGRLGNIDSPAYCFHRAPFHDEFNWGIELDINEFETGDFYYVRVRQKNDHWAWSSPVFID